MSSLAPPPSRHRASSTSLRPSLTVQTCNARTRSSSVSSLTLLTPPCRVSVKTSPRPALSTVSMLPTFFSKSLQFLHPSDHTFTPSSSFSDDAILPLSASPTRSSFEDVFVEDAPSSGYPSRHSPILFVIILFPITASLVFLSLATLPVSISWPETLNDLADLGRELHRYSQSGNIPLAHVVSILSITAVWKHTWSIPGSVVWNVLSGALFHPVWATLLLTLLTAIGSVLATLLSRPMAPFLLQWFPRALAATRNALQGNTQSPSTARSKTPTWVRLSILRLIGVVPWSGINIACGVSGVAISDCFLGSFIGALPWTAVTCQIGDILQTVASTPSSTSETVSSLLTSPDIILKLVVLSIISLAPILGRDRLRALVSRSSPESDSEKEFEERRFRWISEWRSKIRIPSRSRSRESYDSYEIQEKDNRF